MTQPRPIPLELLAPARDCEVGRHAILHGADAVYIGGPTHGARAAAGNSIEDIAELCRFAHAYRCRVYVTLNTIIFDSEIPAVEALVDSLYRAGVDALIVQDMALLRMRIPPIALHASTQCDMRSPRKAAFLAACGFSQLVLPRELSEQEIREMRQAVPADVALEAFVHGALCVSYSGDCQASFATGGRSANRGRCAQMCRLPYTLTDANGRVLARDLHLLSLRDMRRLDQLPAMAMAGVQSFKIEGRLKDAAYVKTVVGAYRRALDKLIAEHPDKFCRASQGRSVLTFEPRVEQAFNRGFTSYFFAGRDGEGNGKMASHLTPKWVGLPVGKVTANRGRFLQVDATAELHNGDGLGYFRKDGSFAGFRANRVEAGRVFPLKPVDVPAGATLYRNLDTEQETALARPTAQRLLDLNLTLRMAGNNSLCLCARTGEDYAEVAVPFEPSEARTPQTDARARVLTKLGDTVYSASQVNDLVPPDVFIPASTLTALRRQAIEALDRQRRATYQRELRRPEDRCAELPSTVLTYHDNVANVLARQFYLDHGAESILPALETGAPADVPEDTVVMTTRYCLRRELGECPRLGRSSDGATPHEPLPKSTTAPLYIENANARFRLSFDCAACRMHLHTTKSIHNS